MKREKDQERERTRERDVEKGRKELDRERKLVNDKKKSASYRIKTPEKNYLWLKRLTFLRCLTKNSFKMIICAHESWLSNSLTKKEGRHSTEVAVRLLTWKSWVRISLLLKFFCWSYELSALRKK